MFASFLKPMGWGRLAQKRPDRPAKKAYLTPAGKSRDHFKALFRLAVRQIRRALVGFVLI
ncbi:hypothetical protein B5E43_08240 [Flavonifractor sp. An100]|nr:hypothetical protein B5E43_08240 [Flavonifractor sp. An100]